MPDASPHCKPLAAELGGALTERLAAKGGVAKASDAPEALGEIKVISRPQRPQAIQNSACALVWQTAHR